jgi:hypothetical protein
LRDGGAFDDDAGVRRPVVPYVISLLEKQFGRVAEKGNAADRRGVQAGKPRQNLAGAD